MAIKLFVSDIDGTLLMPGKMPSEKNIEAIHKMQKAGIIFTIATGRMYPATVPIVKAIGVDAPIISYNGAMIRTQEKILHSDYIQKDLICEIVDFFQARNFHLQTYSNDVLRYPAKNKLTDMYEASQKTLGESVGWEGLKKFTENVCKLLGLSDIPEECSKISAELRENFSGRIEVTRSAPMLVEIMNKGVSKAAAVKILAQKFNIDISEVAAIGDSDNDLSMLKVAGTSIAMGNATDEVKKTCKFITSGCEADGFAAAVEKFILA